MRRMKHLLLVAVLVAVVVTAVFPGLIVDLAPLGHAAP
jgi:hypothetical protein